MKYIFSLLVLISLASCNDKTTQASKPSDTIKKDPDTLNNIKGISSKAYIPVDISPMDMSYLPAEYPILKMSGKTTKIPVARVIYSRPHRQGRKIFGTLLKYGEPWRLGANEATEIEVFQPITIQNKTIPKGRYILYCIPQQDKWTIVFNSNLYTWGLKQEPKMDLYHFDIPVQNTDQTFEFFTMVFENTGKGADLVMSWENTEARLPIEYSEK